MLCFRTFYPLKCSLNPKPPLSKGGGPRSGGGIHREVRKKVRLAHKREDNILPYRRLNIAPVSTQIYLQLFFGVAAPKKLREQFLEGHRNRTLSFSYTNVLSMCSYKPQATHSQKVFWCYLFFKKGSENRIPASPRPPRPPRYRDKMLQMT